MSHAAMRLTSIESSFYPCKIYCDCQGRPKCAKKLLKWRTFKFTDWITGKRLKIDRYMLRCVWQASNPLFIHVTFTAIVPGAYPGEARMCLRLIAETDTRSVGDSHPSCNYKSCVEAHNMSGELNKIYTEYIVCAVSEQQKKQSCSIDRTWRESQQYCRRIKNDINVRLINDPLRRVHDRSPPGRKWKW